MNQLPSICRKVENQTGNRLTEPVFKTARKPETNHKPNRTEPNRNRTVPGFAGAASKRQGNKPALLAASGSDFCFRSARNTRNTAEIWQAKKAAHARSVTCFFGLLGFDRRQHREKHRHGIPFQSGSANSPCSRRIARAPCCSLAAPAARRKKQVTDGQWVVVFFLRGLPAPCRLAPGMPCRSPTPRQPDCQSFWHASAAEAPLLHASRQQTSIIGHFWF